MDGTAVVFTDGQLDHPAAKTTHGLIRGTERYKILAVLDHHFAGKDAGEIIDGKKRDIPIYASLQAYLDSGASKPDYFIIGIANAGGKLNPDWIPAIKDAISKGISVVNGMHQFLANTPEIAELAAKHQVQLIDVRKPPKRDELHFWTGKIFEVPCPRIAVIGTDCAVGKRTTARFLMEACRAEGLNAQMIYTGQTGWMQGGTYGFIFDSTLNDFVSGEMERAILQCYEETQPDIIFIEGQSALRNPSGPAGAELLLSAHANGAIIVHPEGREFYKGWDFTGKRIPPASDEAALVKMYGVEPLGIAINTKGVTYEQAKDAQQRYEAELNIPVALPVEEGVDRLLPPIKKLIAKVRT